MPVHRSLIAILAATATSVTALLSASPTSAVTSAGAQPAARQRVGTRVEATPMVPGGPTVATGRTRVIVRAKPGQSASAKSALRRLGGTVRHDLPIVNGFSAELPTAKLDALRTSGTVWSVAHDARLRPTSLLPGTNYDAASRSGSMYNSTYLLGARDAWRLGYTGHGIDVALIDTGVTAVAGLNGTGKLVHGPDLSFESPNPNRRYVDNYGHGTHLAGIIAGNDIPGSTGMAYATAADTTFVGAAPNARVVSMKVGDGHGVADVSQVIAALDWLRTNGRSNGLNVRVITLAYSTDSTQDPHVDPLSFAVEEAWRAGFVVVTSAGNTSSRMMSPSTNPYVLAVGAVNPGSISTLNDDTVATFSGTGNAFRYPDIVSVGVSIQSLRAPGSYVDTNYASGRLGTRYFLGSGTSQATAFTAGLSALMLQRNPSLAPDDVKLRFKSTARWLPASWTQQGAGVTTGQSVTATSVGGSPYQGFTRATGGGSIHQARGRFIPTLGNVAISGNVDIFGRPLTYSSQNRPTWVGGAWNGSTWTGSTWTGSTWTGSTWTGSTWTGSTWTGSTWTGSGWSASTWTGSTWSSDSMNGEPTTAVSRPPSADPASPQHRNAKERGAPSDGYAVAHRSEEDADVRPVHRAGTYSTRVAETTEDDSTRSAAGAERRIGPAEVEPPASAEANPSWATSWG